MSLLGKVTRHIVVWFWLLKYSNGISAGYRESHGGAWSMSLLFRVPSTRGRCLHFTLQN